MRNPWLGTSALAQSVSSVHSTFSSVQTFWMLLTTSEVALG